MPESDTSMRGYLAALYAGTMLFILGFTPEQWMSSESCKLIIERIHSHSPTFSPPRNILTSIFGYFFISS